MWILFDPAGQNQNSQASVYLMDCGEAVKIGVSKDIARRTKSLTKASGRKVSAIYVLSGEYEALDVERYLHKIFSSQRMEGEWFAISMRQVKSIVIHPSSFPRRPKKQEMSEEDSLILLDRLFGSQEVDMVPVDSIAGLLTAIAMAVIKRDPKLNLAGVLEQAANSWMEMGEDEFREEFEALLPRIQEHLRMFLKSAQARAA